MAEGGVAGVRRLLQSAAAGGRAGKGTRENGGAGVRVALRVHCPLHAGRRAPEGARERDSMPCRSQEQKKGHFQWQRPFSALECRERKSDWSQRQAHFRGHSLLGSHDSDLMESEKRGQPGFDGAGSILEAAAAQRLLWAVTAVGRAQAGWEPPSSQHS